MTCKWLERATLESRQQALRGASRYEPYAVLNSSTGSMLAGGTKGHTHFGMAPVQRPLRSKRIIQQRTLPGETEASAEQRRPQLKFNPILFDSFFGDPFAPKLA